MSSYPKWLYHPSEAPKVVADEAAHKALGASWVESPALVVKPEAKSLGDLLKEPAPEKPKRVK